MDKALGSNWQNKKNKIIYLISNTMARLTVFLFRRCKLRYIYIGIDKLNFFPDKGRI